jgi:hypothetical protein
VPITDTGIDVQMISRRLEVAQEQVDDRDDQQAAEQGVLLHAADGAADEARLVVESCSFMPWISR